MPILMIAGYVWVTTEIFIWAVSHPTDKTSESPRTVESQIGNC